jgi:hypothetical protein
MSKIPTADVAPREEVELWKGRVEAVFAAIPKTRREFAREIFEEVQKTLVFGADRMRITELKKKYTEE